MKRLFLALIIAAILPGCFQMKGAESTTVQIRTKKTTNDGTALYVVIKESSMANFLMDDYDEIATQAFLKEDEKIYLTKTILVPGKTEKLKIPVIEKGKSIGIYFIFTNPGECWKCFVDNPQSKNVKILLGKDEYEAINVY